jgi:integrase/recombinase XerD
LHRIFRYWQDDPAFPHTQAYDPFALALSALDLERTGRREYPWIALHTLREIVAQLTHVRARALVVLQLKLGLRASEVCNLRLGDLHLTDPECRRWYELGTHEAVVDRPDAIYVATNEERAGNKSARPRVLPVDEEVQDVLRAWLLVRPQPGHPWVFLTAGTHTRLDAASVNRAWTAVFHPRFAATESHRAVTSHYGRHRFTTFWRIEQELPRELVQYMRGDVLGKRTTSGSGRTAGGYEAIDDYLHAYYEDIESVYRDRMYSLGVDRAPR